MIYFLSSRLGNRFVRDLEGIDLPDVAAARQEAIVSARQLMADAILHGHDISDSVFEIVENGDGIVAKVPFTEAFGRIA